eukprot:SAG22_NODE_340_length_12031_cov_9.961783_8_plen_183_part_00
MLNCDWRPSQSSLGVMFWMRDSHSPFSFSRCLTATATSVNSRLTLVKSFSARLVLQPILRSASTPTMAGQISAVHPALSALTSLTFLNLDPADSRQWPRWLGGGGKQVSRDKCPETSVPPRGTRVPSAYEPARRGPEAVGWGQSPRSLGKSQLVFNNILIWMIQHRIYQLLVAENTLYLIRG